jgi:actin-related protein
MTAQPVLLTDTAFALTSQREKMMELMFEAFDVPAMYLARSSVLSAFSVGRCTALVVDVGASGARVVPVVDGFILNRPGKRCDFGAERLTEALDDWLKRSGTDVRLPHRMTKRVGSDGSVEISDRPEVSDGGWTASFEAMMRLDVIRDIKETALTVFPEPYKNIPLTPVLYELPDGTELKFGPEQCSLPELHFDSSAMPDFVHAKTSGLAHTVLSSLQACDVDIRRELCANIVLVGGGSCLRGMEKRLQKDLSAMIPPAFKPRIVCPPPLNRSVATWTGGSILASLGSFHQMWVSKAEYHEDGAGIIERKCP